LGQWSNLVQESPAPLLNLKIIESPLHKKLSRNFKSIALRCEAKLDYAKYSQNRFAFSQRMRIA
jgi:hypothetical protein